MYFAHISTFLYSYFPGKGTNKKKVQNTQKTVSSEDDKMHAPGTGRTGGHGVTEPQYLEDGVHDNSQRPVTRQLCDSKHVKTPFVHIF